MGLDGCLCGAVKDSGRCTYKIPKPIKPTIEILVLRLIWTFQRRGTGSKAVTQSVRMFTAVQA